MYALNSAPSKLQPRPIATPAPMFGVVLSNPVWVGVGVGALHTSASAPILHRLPKFVTENQPQPASPDHV